MSGQVSRGSAGKYQADEQAGVWRLRWRVSGSRAGRCCAAPLVSDGGWSQRRARVREEGRRGGRGPREARTPQPWALLLAAPKGKLRPGVVGGRERTPENPGYKTGTPTCPPPRRGCPAVLTGKRAPAPSGRGLGGLWQDGAPGPAERGDRQLLSLLGRVCSPGLPPALT